MPTEAKSKDVAAGEKAEQWIRIPKAAEILGVTPSTVREMALKNELEHQVFGGIVFISRESATRAAPSPAPESAA